MTLCYGEAAHHSAVPSHQNVKEPQKQFYFEFHCNQNPLCASSHMVGCKTKCKIYLNRLSKL